MAVRGSHSSRRWFVLPLASRLHQTTVLRKTEPSNNRNTVSVTPPPLGLSSLSWCWNTKTPSFPTLLSRNISTIYSCGRLCKHPLVGASFQERFRLRDSSAASENQRFIGIVKSLHVL